MNEALAAGQEPQGTEEEINTSVDEAQVASPETPDADAAPQDEQQGEEKKLSGFARRMQRLEAQFQSQVEATKAELEYWKAEAMKKATPQETPKGRMDFASDEEWIEHRLEAERQRLLQEAQEAAHKTVQVERVVGSYQQRVNEAKKELSDWDNVFQQAQAAGATLPQDAVEFCLESDQGARIAYHLAKNEDEYEKFVSMSPVRRIAYLGKLEDKLAKPKEAPPKQVTKAPAKLADVKPGSSVKPPPTGMERFQSKQAWKEWRSKQGKR